MLISFQLISGLELFFANGPYSYCYRAAGLNQRFLHLKFAIDSRVALSLYEQDCFTVAFIHRFCGHNLCQSQVLISFQLISGLELFFANGPYSYCYRAAGLNQRFLHLKFAIDSRVVLIYSWTINQK